MDFDTPVRPPVFDVRIDGGRRDVTVVSASGELDLAADPLLGATLVQAETLGLPVLVDMTQVTFCASSTLSQLAATATRSARAGRPLVVASAEYAVIRPWVLLGLDGSLTVVTDVATALQRLGLPECFNCLDGHA